MPSAMSIEQRLQAVESVQALHALKARYAGLADAKYTADRRRQPEARMRELARQQAECFTEDAVWQGGAGFGDDLSGRARLEEWFARSPWSFAVHLYGSPEILVEGDRATGRWRLWQMAVRDADRQAVLLAAVTEEHYLRQPDGAWLIDRMQFSQMHILPAGGGSDPLVSSLADIVARSA